MQWQCWLTSSKYFSISVIISNVDSISADIWMVLFNRLNVHRNCFGFFCFFIVSVGEKRERSEGKRILE